MSKIKTTKQIQTNEEIKKRAFKTSYQIFISVALAVYPVLLSVANLGDWAALKAAVPVLVTTAIGAIVSFIDNKIREAKGRDL